MLRESVLRNSVIQLRPLIAACTLMASLSAQAVVNFSVSFDDPTAAYSSYYADITRNVQAAGADWLSCFQGQTANTTLDISIGFAPIPTANGASATSHFVNTGADGLFVYEQGAAAKLKTGLDDNGAAPDIRFNIGTNGYLQSELWFDPNPAAQTTAVPDTKTDARSVFLHEFGHAWGFNGWRTGASGVLPGNYQSTFDALSKVVHSDGRPTQFFTGANAIAAYGAMVPITFGNYSHVGNYGPLPGADLVPDLMNGLVFFRGTRYQISALDLAILQDVGLPVAVTAVPEPGSVLMMLAGLVCLLGVRRHR
jgi:PEP-CTERM motif